MIRYASAIKTKKIRWLFKPLMMAGEIGLLQVARKADARKPLPQLTQHHVVNDLIGDFHNPSKMANSIGYCTIFAIKGELIN